MVRYEDGEIEFCAFYRNQREAMKGRTYFKRKFKRIGSVEKKTISRTKEGFLNLFTRYAVKSRKV